MCEFFGVFFVGPRPIKTSLSAAQYLRFFLPDLYLLLLCIKRAKNHRLSICYRKDLREKKTRDFYKKCRNDTKYWQKNHYRYFIFECLTAFATSPNYVRTSHCMCKIFHSCRSNAHACDNFYICTSLGSKPSAPKKNNWIVVIDASAANIVKTGDIKNALKGFTGCLLPVVT